MNKSKHRNTPVLGLLAAILVGVSLLSGCKGADTANPSQAEPAESGPVADPAPQEPSPGVSVEAPLTETPGGNGEARYIDILVRQTVDGILEPGMSEFDKAKAAFDYMIENTTLLDPVGLDLWRIRGDYAQPPAYVENRSLSVLLFRLGKCEDYAAALTLLLRGMGLGAEYIPGLTYSTQGELVDHAWTMVRVDGTWYHLDCQLEQNISRHGSCRYKYFMRSDATMAGSHRWGQNLINSGLLRQDQNEEIARDHIPPAAPRDYPTPARRAVTLPQAPDVEAIQAEIAAEFREYEEAHGPLEPLEINTVPPVFALEGFGPQD